MRSGPDPMSPLPTNETPKKELPKAKVANFEAVVRALNTALSTTAMYPERHPMRAEAAKAAKAGVDAWFRAESALDIGFSPDNVLLAGQTVKEKDSLFTEVANHFHSRGVLAIALNRSVSVEELTSLFDALLETPEAIAKAGGVVRRMRPSTHIKVKEIDYAAVLAGSRRQAASGSEPLRMWESLCRIGDELWQGGVTKSKLEALEAKLGNPRAAADAFNTAYAKAGRDGDAVAGKIWQLVGGLLRDEGVVSPDKVRALRKCLTSIAGQLSPDLAASLLAQSTEDATTSALEDVFAEGMSDDAMAATIVSFMGRQGAIDSRMVTLFQKMSAQPKRSSAVAALVAGGLRKKAGGTTEGLAQIQEALLTAMKTTDLNAFMSEVYRLTVDMLPTRAGQVAGLPERLVPVVHDYEQLAGTDAGAKQAWTDLVLNILWFDDDPTSFEAFNDRLIALFGEDASACDERLIRSALKLYAAKVEQPRVPEAIVQISGEALRRIGKLAGAARMVSLIAGSDEDELKGLRRALDGIEVGSADALLDAFLRESRGETRAKLAFMLWDVPFTHKQMRAIVKSLDRERNAKERDAVLGALIGSSDAKRMDTLFGCLRGGLFINRHLHALVRVCGERRRAEAVRHLGAVLAWHPRFYQRGGDALRAAAAVSLGQIGSDESLAVLGQYAGDRDPAVRKACERAIAAPRVK
jgi:hypothetical protein